MQQDVIQSDVLTQRDTPVSVLSRTRLYHQLAQIAAIARYEYLMQWRRRALIVITLAMLLVAAVPTIVLRNELYTEADFADALGKISTTTIVSFIFIPVGAVLAMVVPFIMGDVIPKDNQLGVRDVLFSTPLSAGPYLLGKLLGSWLSIGAGVVAVIIPTGVLWYVLIGPIQPGTYLEPWLIGALPMIVINVGLTVLLTATQPDPRRAILVVVIIVVLIPMVIGFDPHGDWRDAFNPLRPGVFFHYTDTLHASSDSMAMETGNPNIRLISVEATIISGLAQVGFVWFLIWRWLRRQMG